MLINFTGEKDEETYEKKTACWEGKKRKTSRMQKNKFLFSIIYLRNGGGGKSSFMKKRLFCNIFKTCMSKS